MYRRDIFALIGGAAAWPVAARAQQTERVRRIALLMGADDKGPGQAQANAFRQGLEALGWTDGRNLRIEIRSAGGEPERYRPLAIELIALAPEVIVTQSNTATTVVSQLTRTIPIVFAGASDPFESGLITNMARPGGNVTGFSQLETAIVGKYLDLLKEAVPTLTRVAVIYTRGGVAASAILRKEPIGIDGGQAMSQCQSKNLLAMSCRGGARQHDEAAVRTRARRDSAALAACHG